jgi:hypothetical protein
MEELYVAIVHLCSVAVYLLATALHVMRRLPATGAWLWLERAGTCEPAASICVVLLHHLSGLLLAAGSEVFRHG